MTHAPFTLGDWQVEPAGNRLLSGEAVVEVEPRVMDLLVLFARHPGEVLSKDAIAEAIWGGLHVNDDALTRTIFKLRRALGDDARNPRYIGTVAKRGYRLLVPVEGLAAADAVAPEPGPEADSGTTDWRLWAGAALGVLGVLLVASWLLTWTAETPESDARQQELATQLDRADAFYHQFTRADNAAAQRLYETVLARDPGNAAALAGLSNVVTQTVIRYSRVEDGVVPRSSLGEALSSGSVDTPEGVAAIARAVALAEQACEADPGHARAWRALGLARSAQRDFAGARAAYERALVIAPDDWGTLINLADINGLEGDAARATAYLELAFEAMAARYDRETIEIRPWHSEVGLSIAERKLEASLTQEAEAWYRRVLALDPLNAEAVRGLARLLEAAGDAARAQSLCSDLVASTGVGCDDPE